MTWLYEDWYREHKAEISATRKRKYKKNKAYRDEAKKRARDYYNRNKKVMRPVDRFRVRDADGKNYVTIGRVARAIGRVVDVVRSYHRRGVLPDTGFVDTRGWRLYTNGQLLLLMRAFKMFDRKELKSLGEVGEYLNEHWRD